MSATLNLHALSSSTLASRKTDEQTNAKKQKTELDTGRSVTDELGERLYSLRNFIRQNNNINVSTLEVEVRFGMIVDGNRRWKRKINRKGACAVDDFQRSASRLQFKAGVDPIFAKKLKAKLSSKDVMATLQPPQKIRCDDANNRWQIDSHGNVLMSESKSSLLRHDIALLAHDYDLRMNLASENGHARNNGHNGINRDAWVQERNKRRTSYAHRQYKCWRMDYTEVEVVYNRGAGGKTREIEFELEMDAAFARQWLEEPNDNRAIELTRQVTYELECLVDLLVPFESEVHAETSLAAVTTLEHELFNANALVQINRKGFEFIGSMPVNLTRQNLVAVNNTNYFLTEKSDGTRYLLYVVSDTSAEGRNRNIAVLVDRSKRAFRFRGSHEVGACLALGSILDGEMVFNLEFRENVFLVFDVLAWRGASHMQQPFGVRKALIQSEVLPQYEAGIENLYRGSSSGSSSSGATTAGLDPHPLKLIRKVFLDKSELRVLLDRMRVVDGEHVYRADAKRYHRSDGLIFQPDLPYVSSRNYDLLKWKWAELRSVDLEVVVETAASTGAPVVYLLCLGEDNTQVNCTRRGAENIGLGVYDTYRLLADREEVAMRAGRTIVEVAYDVTVGMWEYVQIRRDKNEPNFIATVMGVFMEQAESISVEELEYILNAAASGLENDYEHQLSKMKMKLLEWQRAECKKRLTHK